MKRKIKITFDSDDSNAVELGQVRKGRCGRTIVVIEAKRMNDGYVERTYKALVVRESTKGRCVNLSTVPIDYTLEKIEEDFPIVLDGELLIKEASTGH